MIKLTARKAIVIILLVVVIATLFPILRMIAIGVIIAINVVIQKQNQI